jgi:hypothetical protein
MNTVKILIKSNSLYISAFILRKCVKPRLANLRHPAINLLGDFIPVNISIALTDLNCIEQNSVLVVCPWFRFNFDLLINQL